jgi:hypothetical protein
MAMSFIYALVSFDRDAMTVLGPMGLQGRSKRPCNRFLIRKLAPMSTKLLRVPNGPVACSKAMLYPNYRFMTAHRMVGSQAHPVS